MFIEKVQRWLTQPETAVPALPEGFDLEGRRRVVWLALEALECPSTSPKEHGAWIDAVHSWSAPERLPNWLGAFLQGYRAGVGSRFDAEIDLGAVDAALRSAVLQRPVQQPQWSQTVKLELYRLAIHANRIADAAAGQAGTPDMARWSVENGLVDPHLRPTTAGRALMELRGRDAVELALAIGVELSVGPFDPWRLGQTALHTLAEGPVTHWLDMPFEACPFNDRALDRVVQMGVGHSDFDTDQIPKQVYHLHPDARDLVLRVATQPDSRFRAMARTLLDVERGRINVETTGRGQTDLGDMSYARSVAHEIRNLLLPLHTALDALWEELGQDQPDHARRQKLRERIDRSTDRLAEFAADAVRLSAAIQPEELNLAEVIAEATAATEAERNGRIRIEVAALAKRRIIGTRRDWIGAFINLFRNAAQVRAGKGTVWVSTLVDDAGGLHIYVDDDGPGVPEELRERVFEFGHSTRGGSGVGLADARRCALASGGQLRCEASPQGGARFHFALPRQSTT